jgi:TRAP-type C4-dicarboxylate transport system substrate-binding protein
MSQSAKVERFGHTKSRTLAAVVAASLILAVGLSAVATASTKTAVKKPKPPVYTSANISLQVNPPVGSDLGTYLLQWIATVKKESKGKINITPYYQGQLYTNVTSVPAVQSGALDLDLIDIGTLSSTLPAFGAAVLPFAGADYAQIEQFTGPTSPVYTWLSRYAPHEHLVLFPTPVLIPGDQTVMLKAPITSLEGLKGQSIRSIGGSFDKLFSGLGANPVDLPASSVPTALQAGTVTGALGSLSVMTTTWKGLGNTAVDLGTVLLTGYYMVANSGDWGNLSEADRTLLTTSYQGEFNVLKPQVASLQLNALATWTAISGNTVYNLTAADQAELKPILAGIWTSFATAYPATYNAVLKAVKKFKLQAYTPS